MIKFFLSLFQNKSFFFSKLFCKKLLTQVELGLLVTDVPLVSAIIAMCSSERIPFSANLLVKWLTDKLQTSSSCSDGILPHLYLLTSDEQSSKKWEINRKSLKKMACILVIICLQDGTVRFCLFSNKHATISPGFWQSWNWNI